ncbi:hypothetical protein GCM10023153_09670 [Ornithinibacter aureus]|uniref:Aminoglycoside phosphotransferase domain-containing protein n=1 Tax=Ornithinibacter aureus TaxID=622664 RepID=A0ABP8JJ11_9MICO|nr:phosphotransferase [Ornithinibacter aureus]KAF0833771.1 phosphotransferase family enzyme [Ornithinibacter aureus]
MERDLPALWRSPQWRAELEAWLLPALADAGRTVTGPLVQERVRFWSTVLSVETDAGRVWVKENAPSQAFEAALVDAIDGIVPRLCAPVVAVEADRGWLATADLGAPLWHEGATPSVDDWVAVVERYGQAQRDLSNHADAVLAAGVPVFPHDPADVTTWVTDLVTDLRALPREDPRRPTDEEAALVDDGLGRIHEAAAVLVDSGMPSTLQHNDLHLGNAFRGPGLDATFIDLGDAVWAHPLTALRIPLWTLRHLYDDDVPDGAAASRVLTAGIAPWTDVWDVHTLTQLLPAAERISCLHRAESWSRLQRDVPVHVVEQAWVRSVIEWVVDAAAQDPYASSLPR